MNETLVHGIPCISCNSVFLGAIASTLNRIREKAPKDYDRVVSLVNAFEACEMDEECTSGEWVSAQNSSWDYGIEDSPGRILLNKNLQMDRITAVIAHELGHAATRLEDRLNRGAVSEEWQSELAADWYAYKWGFGREIAKNRKSRDWRHHSPGPGKTFSEQFDGQVYHYKISRSFVAHLEKTEEGYFTLEWYREGTKMLSELAVNNSVEIDLIDKGLEKAVFVGNCSQNFGFWMYEIDESNPQQNFRGLRLTWVGECTESLCKTKYPIREPQVNMSSSVVLDSVISRRLIDSEYPAIGEYLVIVHSDICTQDENSGESNLVISWVSAKDASVYQEKVFTGKAWFGEEGKLLSATAEIEKTVDGNGIQLKISYPESADKYTENVRVFTPPAADSRENG